MTLKSNFPIIIWAMLYHGLNFRREILLIGSMNMAH